MKLVDDSGVALGTVRDLIVNTDTGNVERLVLDNRAEYAVQDVALAGDNLRLRREEFMTGGGTGAALDPDSALHVRCERV
jgi:sporulation protein YlmC with PRC-barrel domain